ncbi:hypothetical protein [Plebeiibacterium sediminum]|uniref:Uncharacterized protein n=1 Tax=Plebeiibacterium sediminum TaxID=2992112 RepID=A0AAE3M964_9BACT|nr:hypothetical protein [Plebeiobacterium sediminum]MCW3789551.1 hypothetical protein [Plebeiobacterium sediminum]
MTDIKQELEISDDSGFIGIINDNLYQGFVDEDWELDEVLGRFKNQTNFGNCAIWSTGEPNFMSIHIVDKPSQTKSYRETITFIKVTNENLWLANYTDLTMVAQFESEKIPSNENSDLIIELKNGFYKLLIRQMFNPSDYNWESPPNPCFELIFQTVEKFENNNFENVIWWDVDNHKE